MTLQDCVEPWVLFLSADKRERWRPQHQTEVAEKPPGSGPAPAGRHRTCGEEAPKTGFNKALKEKFKKLMASRILLRVSVSPRGTEVTDTIATL
jgi:hypothetical protein